MINVATISFLNILMAMGIFALGSCSKMDDTYHKFWDEGEHIYPASADSLKSFSGKDRVKLQWLIVGDPTIRKAVIYWNNRADSMVVPINKDNAAGIDTMNVFIDNLSEGTYSFEVFTFDQYGNRSVEANTTGKVYGDSYANSLLTRIVENNSYLNNILNIQWGAPADASSLGAEIEYTDTDGNKTTLLVDPDAETTTINDFGFSYSKYFKYRTLFLPDSTAIDTFYTDYDSVRVLGPRTRVSDKTAWTVTVSSYDNRNGRTDRLPEKLIDGNTSTAWVNLVGSTSFPHTATIDMGTIETDIFGLSIYLVSRNESPRSMNVSVSENGTDWQPLGLMDIKNEEGWQYFDFSAPLTFRYLKMVFEDSYGSSNIVLYEASVFTR